jgi:hypothetical protein
MAGAPVPMSFLLRLGRADPAGTASSRSIPRRPGRGETVQAVLTNIGQHCGERLLVGCGLSVRQRDNICRVHRNAAIPERVQF